MLHIIPVVIMPVFIEVCELIIQSAIFVVVIPFILPIVFIQNSNINKVLGVKFITFSLQMEKDDQSVECQERGGIFLYDPFFFFLSPLLLFVVGVVGWGLCAVFGFISYSACTCGYWPFIRFELGLSPNSNISKGQVIVYGYGIYRYASCKPVCKVRGRILCCTRDNNQQGT